MKKFVSLLLVLVMVLSLAACGSKPAAEAPAEAEAKLKTLTAGKLTMVTSPDFAPYEFYALDENGKPTLAGFDIALGQYIADYLGLELEILPMDFDGTITELGAGKADIGMAGYSPDPDREKAMSFSDVYYTGGQSFVCHKDNASKFTSLADANKAEYQIGAQLASIQYDLAMENTPDADIVELSKVTDIIAELLAGHLDGAYIETAVAESYAKNYPELAIVLPVPYEQEGSVVGVYKGNAELLAGINEAIAAAIADGSMDSFVAEANELASDPSKVHEGLLEEK